MSSRLFIILFAFFCCISTYALQEDLNWGYTRDSEHIYKHEQVLNGIDPETFGYDAYDYIYDKNGVYKLTYTDQDAYRLFGYKKLIGMSSEAFRVVSELEDTSYIYLENKDGLYYGSEHVGFWLLKTAETDEEVTHDSRESMPEVGTELYDAAGNLIDATTLDAGEAIEEYIDGLIQDNRDVYMYAQELADEGYIVNQADVPRKYRLDDTLLRQEMIGIGLRVQGIEKQTDYTCQNYYDDDFDNEWVCQAVEQAADEGIISRRFDKRAGTRLVRPKREVSNIEAMAMITNSLCINYENDTQENNDWRTDLLSYFTNKGLTSIGQDDLNEKVKRGTVFYWTAELMNEGECIEEVSDTQEEG